MRPVADPQGHPRSPAEPPAPLPPSVDPPPPPPAPPEDLGEVGRRVWAEVWTAGGNSYRPESDGFVIARYASLQERRLTLLATLEREGMVTVGSQGQDVAHPAAKLLLDVEGKLLPLEDRLGLSPEARLRLGIQAVEHKSALDAFLEGN